MEIKKIYIDDPIIDHVQDLIGDSFFASTEFLSIWHSLKGRGCYFTALVDSQLIGLLPGVEFGTAATRRFQSLVDGLMSPLIIVDNYFGEKDKIASGFLAEVKAQNYLKYHWTDFYNQFNFDDIDFISQTTHLVDVSSDFIPPDKKLQSELRKAERETVAVLKYDPSRHFEKFLTLMKKTEARHERKQKYSDNFFDRLGGLSKSCDKIIWLYCEYENQPVCSHINFIEGDTMYHWQVYFDKQFSSLKANQLMLYESINEAAARNVSKINLGVSPEDAEDLVKYKKKWGAREYKYRIYYQKKKFGFF